MKTKNLLKKAFLLLALMGGASSAWAADIYKLQLNGSNVEYVNGDKTAGAMTFFSYNSAKHNFNTKFTGCTYDGVDYTSGLKMEGATNVSWTSTSSATVTIVQSTWSNHTIKFDDSALDVSKAVAGTSCRIYTISDVAAGDHSVTRGSGESGVFAITVEYSGGDPSDTSSPSITTDLDDETPYEVNVGSPLALTIVAEHYTGFQWYTCDSEGNSAEAISGATLATYNYTPIVADVAASPKYFKCIVTNTNATGAKTATSKIATVNVTASTDASAKSVTVVANGTYGATAEGTAYSATIAGTSSATVTITPNDGTAIVSSGATVGAAGAAISVPATVGTQLNFSITAGDGETIVNYTLDITKASDKVATNNAYYLSVGEEIYGGQQVIGDHITMTYSNAANGTFAKAIKDDFIKEHDANYVASTAGNGQNGSASGITGTWYKFSPSISGTLTVGSVINDGKQLYIYKDDKNTKITDGVTYWAYGGATLNADLKASGKVQGLITLDVEGGHDYYFSVGGSKMGYYGFEFTPTVSKTITSAGWATYCSPYALDLANATGLTDAYIITGATGSVLSTTSVKDGTIPANTGILIEAPVGTVTIPVVASSSTDVSTNKLVGVLENTEKAAESIYVLMDETAGVGFYKNNNAFTVGANTAYLNANFAGGSSPARSSYFFRGDITGVDNVEATSKAAVKEGKFIENGKLVIVKNGQKFNAAGAQVK